MIIYEYLVKAIQDDARRAGERNRLRLEAQRARRARRQRLLPLLLRGGLTGNSPQLPTSAPAGLPSPEVTSFDDLQRP